MNDQIQEGSDGVGVSPVSFEEVQGGGSESPAGEGNLGLIMDVNVPLSASIGSVRRTISEVLALTPGQVVKLDRLAGDPVDLSINGKLIARGEVVVVDDRYGLRITEICDAHARMDSAAALGV